MKEHSYLLSQLEHSVPDLLHFRLEMCCNQYYEAREEILMLANQALLAMAEVDDEHPFQTCTSCKGPVCMRDVTYEAIMKNWYMEAFILASEFLNEVDEGEDQQMKDFWIVIEGPALVKYLGVLNCYGPHARDNSLETVQKALIIAGKVLDE